MPEILGGENDGTPAEDVLVIRGGPRLFEVLDVQPQIGRLITRRRGPGRELGSRGPHQRPLLGAPIQRDPQVLGKTIRLDGVVTTIIGVMPAGIERSIFEPNADLWVPSRTNAAQVISAAGFLRVFARLVPGTTIEQARQEMSAMARRLAEEFPDSNANRGFGVMSMHDSSMAAQRNRC